MEFRVMLYVICKNLPLTTAAKQKQGRGFGRHGTPRIKC